MADEDLILICPQCGQTDFNLREDFERSAEPFGPITCTKCGHAVTRAEYEASLVKMVAKSAGERFKKD